jgi:MoaA/NifB/PqqE/SkfB family radical SAM enzyme
MVHSLFLELTSHCNLRCPYCFNHSNEGPVQAFAEETLLRVVQEAREALDTDELILSGGEAILHSAWRHVVDVGIRQGMTVSLITNGIGLTDPVVSFLKERGVEVGVSLAGTSCEEDEPVRGPGAWRRSMRGINSLVAAGINPGLIYTVHRANVGSAQRAVELGVAHRVAWVRFTLIRNLGRAQAHWDRIGLSLTDRLFFLTEYARIECPPGFDANIVPDPDLDSAAPLVRPSDRSRATQDGTGPGEACLRFDGKVYFDNRSWESWPEFLLEQGYTQLVTTAPGSMPVTQDNHVSCM